MKNKKLHPFLKILTMKIYHNSGTNYGDKILKLTIMFKFSILINYTSYVKSVAILQAIYLAYLN